MRGKTNMKYLIFPLVFIVTLSSFCLNAIAVCKENIEKTDQSPLVLNLTFNMTSKNKNNHDNTSQTSVEIQQAPNSSSGPGDEKTSDMSPPFTPCKQYFGKKLKECMHRLPRELYQKILRTINDEEVDYYYEQLTIQERLDIRAKKFTNHEWTDLSVEKPQFTTKIDAIVKACKK